MEQNDARAAFAALSHDTRLSVFRLLVMAGPDGLPAGAISERLGVLANTMSSHLSILARARLVAPRRDGRSIRYLADFDGIRDLLRFVLTDCCDGHPQVCVPLAELAAALAGYELQPAEPGADGATRHADGPSAPTPK